MNAILERSPRPETASAGFAIGCTARREEAPGVATFAFARTDGRPLGQMAGQSVTVDWAMPDGRQAMRTFTVSSPPRDDAAFEITVKAMSPKGATADMHARLAPGVQLHAYGPAGGFTLQGHEAPRLLLIGAGSGATPVMAMLRWAQQAGLGSDIVYLHTASTPEDLLFQDELHALDAAMPGLSVHLLPSRVGPGQTWFGPRGRLCRRMLAALVPDLRRREVFCCGPDGFRQAMRLAVRAEGLGMAHYHEERFSAAEAFDAPLFGPASTDAAAVQVTLARSGRSVGVDASTTLNAALRGAGVAVPTGCRQGLCGTCKVRKLSGSAESWSQHALTTAEVEAGMVLTCCSRPKGDLILDL